MNYSAVLLVAQPGRLEQALTDAAAIPGVDIHQIDRSRERAICTLEAASIDDEVRLFSVVRSLEAVLDLSLIEHLPEADVPAA